MLLTLVSTWALPSTRWDDHINNITARANRTLGFLKRNLRGCKTSARARAYEAIVRPTLEYAASIWDPYNTGQINQLEKVQRRAARCTTKNYTDRQPGSVTQMVTQHGWEPLQVRRVKICLLLLFKTQHNLVAIPAEAYLPRLCIFSSWLICPVLYGSHIDAAYSKVGRTIAS
jgi:hypothetical protein